MASPGGFKPSHLPSIRDTGIKGFLKWFQREQPDIYRQVAPKIAASYPQAFSDYTQSVTQQIRASAGRRSLIARYRMRGLSGLGQMPNANAVDPLGEATITGMGYALNPDLTVNTNTFASPYSLDNPVGSIEAITSTTPQIDVADAANSGSGMATAAVSGVSSIIAGITGLFTSVNQQRTAQAITNLQLQRAQNGLAPLNIGMNANGVPTISTGFAPSTLLIAGVALVAALAFFGGRRAAA